MNYLNDIATPLRFILDLEKIIYKIYTYYLSAFDSLFVGYQLSIILHYILIYTFVYF